MNAPKTSTWATVQLPEGYAYHAPDGSEIRLLPEVDGGGMSHCTLPAGSVSGAVYHKTVDEIWYFISGSGEVWRKHEQEEAVDQVGNGVCLSIPSGTRFQFRNTGSAPLCFVIATIPRWPGAEEAVHTDGHWTT